MRMIIYLEKWLGGYKICPGPKEWEPSKRDFEELAKQIRALSKVNGWDAFISIEEE